jgi:hypothetical protein
MKYLKYFKTESEYNSFKGGSDFVLPNVSYIEGSNLYYNPLIESTGSYVAVDLGLPSGTKWANMNVGAISPEDPGLYFQWGDTTGYTIEELQNNDIVAGIKDFNNYFDGTPATGFKKYDKNKLLRLESSDDAASVHMGGSWRMPTSEELNELFIYTIITRYDEEWNEITSSNPRPGSVKYVKFSSNVNDNSIIFWYSGYCDGHYSKPSIDGDMFLHLWSSDLSDTRTDEYINTYMYAKNQNISFQGRVGGYMANDQSILERYCCMPIRGVCK